MSKTTTLLLACLTACLTACAGPAPVKDRAGIAAEEQRTAARSKAIREDAKYVPKIIQNLDKAIDKYFTARAAGADRRALHLRDVLDQTLRVECRKNFDLLVMKAEDSRHPADRSVALVALGFADNTEVRYEKDGGGLLTKKQIQVRDAANRKYTDMALNTLVTALGDRNEDVVRSALLGIGILAHQDTPIADVAAILEDTRRPLVQRTNASWALMVMWDELTPQKREEIHPPLQRLLTTPLGELEAQIACEALYTIGKFRNRRDLKLVEPYTKHPTPLVRVAAAMSLGRMGDLDAVPALLELIKETETNDNVRLTASRSLKALAGGKDRGYDVKSWERLFTLK